MRFDIPYPPTKAGKAAFNRRFGLNAYYAGKPWTARKRDAAMKEIPHRCNTCKHKPQKYGVCGMGCEVDPLTIHHAERCNWAWCGAQGEG